MWKRISCVFPSQHFHRIGFVGELSLGKFWVITYSPQTSELQKNNMLYSGPSGFASTFTCWSWEARQEDKPLTEMTCLFGHNIKSKSVFFCSRPTSFVFTTLSACQAPSCLQCLLHKYWNVDNIRPHHSWLFRLHCLRDTPIYCLAMATLLNIHHANWFWFKSHPNVCMRGI